MDIKIIKSKRKTISIEIRPDLSIIVRTPLRMKDQAVRDFITQKSDWIIKNLKIMSEKNIENDLKQKLTPFSQEELKDLTEKAKGYFPERVKYFSKIIGVEYNKISIKHQKTRWGSCSSKGNLNFNCLLMLCDEEIRDYVIIHELCHLKELNHSPAFWREVEKYCPNYKEYKNRF